MPTFEAQSLQCQDCSESFEFTAENAKHFEEKGYENLPVRCDKCRRAKASSLRRRRAGRERAYTRPIPPPESIKADGKFTHRGGVISFDGTPKSGNGAAKNFGFIDFDGGNVYFALENFRGGAEGVAMGASVDFICDRDDKGRVQAISVFPGSSAKGKKAPKTKTEATTEKPTKTTSSASDKPPREMIDITVKCDGHPNKTVQKPKERATFTIFRRVVANAFGRGFDRKFLLYCNDEALTIATFNALQAGDVVEVRHSDPSA